MLLTALFFGFSSPTVMAQKSVVDWGVCTMVNIIGTNISTTNTSVLSGNAESTDASAPSGLSIQNGIFTPITAANANMLFTAINNQLTNLTSTNTIALNPSASDQHTTILGGVGANHLKPGIYTFTGKALIQASILLLEKP